MALATSGSTFTASPTSPRSVIRAPSTVTMTSPARMPACSATEPAATECTMTPWLPAICVVVTPMKNAVMNTRARTMLTRGPAA